MFYLIGLPHLAKQPAAGLQLIFLVEIQLPSGSVQPGHETPPIKFMSFATGWWFQNVFDTVMTNDKFSCFSGLLKPLDHPDISRPSGAAEDLPEFSTHWSSVAWLKRGPGGQRTMKCGGIPKLCEKSHGSGVFQCEGAFQWCWWWWQHYLFSSICDLNLPWPVWDVWGHMEAFDRVTALVTKLAVTWPWGWLLTRILAPSQRLSDAQHWLRRFSKHLQADIWLWSDMIGHVCVSHQRIF